MTTSLSIAEAGEEPRAPISVEDLARIANAFFSDLPGAAPVAASGRAASGAAPAALFPSASLAAPVAPLLSPAGAHDTLVLPADGAPAAGPTGLEVRPAPAPARTASARGRDLLQVPEIPLAADRAGSYRPPQPEAELGVYREALAQQARRGGHPAHEPGIGPADPIPSWDVPPLSATPGPAGPSYDLSAVRRDFPILAERVNGKRLVWLDNGATTQKPQCVIDRLARFYAHENSNVHRSAHTLAARATDAYEAARSTVASFIGAGSSDEIVFVRGTTEGINLVAQAWGRQHVGPGDEILVSHLEHHANIVPWQQLAAEKGAHLKVIPVDDDGQICLAEVPRLLEGPVKIVAITQVSNALGTVVPVKAVIDLAHARGIPVLVDGAQSIAHVPTDVQALDADFFVFSGHKIYGPTGIGALYAKRAHLADLAPWQGGGNMIADVTFQRTVFQPPPARFEAGTGNLADAVGLAAALDYVSRLGVAAIGAHEHALLEDGTERLSRIPGLRLFGSAPGKAGVLSFTIDGHRPEAIGRALDQHGIAVRTGHHCAQPILRRFGVEATVRATFGLYNGFDDVEHLERALREIVGSGRRPG
jgi:cysteine desulfurase/selenocysteine lyase